MMMAISQRAPAVFSTLSDIPRFEQVLYRVRVDIAMDTFSYINREVLHLKKQFLFASFYHKRKIINLHCEL